MGENKNLHTQLEKEHLAELLKERIYATLALLAVLISIDSGHYTPLKAGLLISGTIVSLWAASIVATLMSRRIVFQNEAFASGEYQIRKHAPMLAALIFPLLMISLAALKIITLSVAVNTSIVGAMLLLVTWSILSARALHATKVPIIILIVVELAIGLGVVGLKVAVGH